MNRIILHIDMDAFFASVEQACSPGLKGRPVAVIGSGKRTVVTTASYEARAFGVKTGMTIKEAVRVCPNIYFVRGNHEKYAYISAKINSIFFRYTPYVEMYSVDESFLDLRDTNLEEESIIKTAQCIKNDIWEECRLTCSIGIAPNKLLAKLVSDISKPDGLFFLCKDDVSGFLENLPVENLCGIGKSTAKLLAKLGIRTCGELGRASEMLLKRYFGINGKKLSLMGKGIDLSPVSMAGEEEEAMSIGHSSTFDRDVFTRQLLEEYLLKLCDMVSERMRREAYWGRVIFLTVRFSDFISVSHQMALNEYIQHTHSIYYYAKALLRKKFRLTKPVRLLGVSVSKLKRNEYQEDFFKDMEKQIRFYKAVDRVKKKFGDESLIWACLIKGAVSISRVISPAWRPDGVRKY